MIVPAASGPSCGPPPAGLAGGDVDGYSQTPIGPFTPGGPTWMWACVTFEMFAAISR